MDIALLINAIVRQTTVLIAQLATSGGVRAPLAQVADQVFLDLTRELEQQGVSRKVGADMFGMALRAYQKKIQRLTEPAQARDRSLWQAVMAFIDSDRPVARADVFRQFLSANESQLRSILYDLVESGLVSSTGSNGNVVYRATTREERTALSQSGGGFEEFLWALIYRQGPFSKAELKQLCGVEVLQLERALAALEQQRRISMTADERWEAKSFEVPMGSRGWEAAMYDHFHALVRTMTARLTQFNQGEAPPHLTGGSTFTFEVWDGHPAAEKVLGWLKRSRTELQELHEDVERHNAGGIPANHYSVIVYAGQCVTDE